MSSVPLPPHWLQRHQSSLSVPSGSAVTWQSIRTWAMHLLFIALCIGRKTKIIGELFGSYRNFSYLCNVRTLVLTIRAESRGGARHPDTTPGARHHRHYSILKPSCKGWFLTFIRFLENREEVTIVNYRTDNGNTLVPFEDKNL